MGFAYCLTGDSVWNAFAQSHQLSDLGDIGLFFMARETEQFVRLALADPELRVSAPQIPTFPERR